MTVKKSIDAKLYYNSASYDTPTWVEIAKLRDLSRTEEYDEIDVTTRASGGAYEYDVGLLKYGLEFDYPDTGDSDTVLKKLVDSAEGRDPIEILALNGDEGTAGSRGIRGTMAIFKKSHDEKLADAQVYSFSLKPTPAAHPIESYTAT